MQTQETGFTLIEVIIFIMITSILAATIVLPLTTSLTKAPTFLKNMIAAQTAKKCMEWFIGQRNLKGYSSVSCPSSTVPGFCTTPSGYNLSVTVSCTSINSDANYKTIAVSVSGNGNASLTSLVANY